MNIIPKSQLQIDLDNINNAAETTTLAMSSCVHALNGSYYSLWNLPDDRLTEVLQALYDNQELYNVFSNHQLAALSLNQVLDNVGHKGTRAKDTAPRQFDILEGKVVLQPIVLPDPEPVYPTPAPD